MVSNQKKFQLDKFFVIKVLLVLTGMLLLVRLFYIQIIRHEYYQNKALSEHIKKFEIAAPRGIIRLQNQQLGSVPVVLNEKRYIIYADPAYIKDPPSVANKLLKVIGGDKNELTKKLSTKDSRYVVLAKKFTKEQAKKISELNIVGIGKKEISVRTYPQENLASHILGFVNDDGKGQYGIEQFLDSTLAGKSGLEKAVTDIRGTPLAISNDNILKQAKAGQDIVLTVDIGMQKIVEDALKRGVERTKAINATGIIIDTHGNIKAMASFPSYNPGQFEKISDPSIFINPAVSMPWEPGSVMKPLIIGAAFSEKSATPETSFYDSGQMTIGDRTISNSTDWGSQTMSFRDIINKSLNTGAVFVLKTLGGGSINDKARNTWYDYMTKHYFFGKNTGVQQGGETSGYVPEPNKGYGLEVLYANTAFGQGVTLTPIQLISAYNALINGGTYYKPNLVAETIDGTKKTISKPEVVARNVVSPQASQDIRQMIKEALEINNRAAVREGYNIGGKSGTAQIAERGVYRTDLYNGAYVGYLGGDTPQYLILVRIDGPRTPGFASAEAYKTWDEISNNLIDNFAIKPKS